jgi:NAD-dependent DNA ligase
MPHATVHYVIINGGDGSAHANFYADEKTAALAAELEEEKGEAFDEHGPHSRTLYWDNKTGALTNPHSTLGELKRELAEAEGDELPEDEDEIAPKFNKAASANDGRAFEAEVHYVVNNGGDGSVSVSFYADEACAEIASQISSEPFCEQPKSQSFKFDAKGTLLNPDATYAEVKAELAEARGEEPDADETEEKEQDLAGKTVVFTGKLSTMTRAEAEADAVARGATIGSGVSKNTDILVVGEDAGSKLAKAKALGVAVVTEAQWTGKDGTSPAKPSFRP